MGVTLVQNYWVKDLLKEQAEGGFHAVFIAIGAGLSKRVDIPSLDASRLVDAVSFLKDVAAGERPKIGRRVAVYGGGNTAMDAARVARRLGAEESIVIYRRTEEQMPAHAEEKDEAMREGVQMHWLRTISEIESGGEIQVEIMELDGKGRAVGTGQYETLQADTVILAVGQETDSNFLRRIPGMRFENDVLKVDPMTLMTDVPGIFAGGDAVPSDRTVTIGVGHGKRAARMIDSWLSSRQPPGVAKSDVVSFEMLHLWYFGDHERRMQSELDVADRTDFQEIVRGLSCDETRFEAVRCLSCGNCIECDGCLGACPEDAVIKLGKGLRYRYDYEKCTGCATCYQQCPVHAIQMIQER
jgi:NADPH-dependent glutamate synthase beta subunit-like oxidoreductase